MRTRCFPMPLSALAFVALASASAHAQQPPTPEDAPTSEASEASGASEAWGGARRPWLYAADPTAPAPLHVIASIGAGYAQVDRGAARPFAADLAHAGAVFDAGAEVGIGRYASVHAQGLLAGSAGSSEAAQGASPVSAGVVAGVSLFPLPAHRPLDLAISAGYLRELGGSNGVWGRVGVARDLGPARLSFTALGEHLFEPGRDGVDILLTTGASFAIGSILRLGAEYVVQDLEGAWEEDEADGGIRHFVGPSAALALADRVQITAGPAFGLAQGSPTVLGRLTAAYAF